MKLGRDTNSVTNWLLSGTNGQPTPVVGMGVTILQWTDRDAGTITWVSPSGKSFRFREDHAKRTDSNGMSENQTYEYTPNPNATERTARRTKGGGYKSAGTRLALGYRNAYHDYCF